MPIAERKRKEAVEAFAIRIVRTVEEFRSMDAYPVKMVLLGLGYDVNDNWKCQIPAPVVSQALRAWPDDTARSLTARLIRELEEFYAELSKI